MASKIEIVGKAVSVIITKEKENYISLTDMAKYKNEEFPEVVISHYLSTRYTIEFMDIWGKMNNKDFNLTESSEIRNESGSNGFVLSAKKG